MQASKQPALICPKVISSSFLLFFRASNVAQRPNPPDMGAGADTEHDVDSLLTRSLLLARRLIETAQTQVSSPSPIRTPMFFRFLDSSFFLKK
jgi:hypothetical protein